MGQSQKYFFKAIYYIARGLCPNFSPLGPKLKEEIGNKGIKWPLLYIYIDRYIDYDDVITKSGLIKSGRYMCRGHVIVVLLSFTLTGSGSKVVGLLETPIMFLLARRVVFSPL